MSLQSRPVRFLHCLMYRFRDDEVPALGAQLTYYLILAFFPFLIFLVSLLGFISLSGEELLHEWIGMLPRDSGEMVRKLMGEAAGNQSRSLLSFGMLATLWAASNGINAVIKGLNKAYDVEEDRPYWKVRGISLAATFVLAVVIGLTLVMLIFGKAIGAYLFELTGFPDSFALVWGIVKYIVPIAAMLTVFLLLYRMTPNRRLTFREVVPGALFTTGGWIIASVLFSFYVNHFANYTRTYGSLGGIIVLLLWLYMSSILLMLGGEINATLTFDKEGQEKREARKYSHAFPFLEKKTGTARSAHRHSI
ncbi:YihY/virulence factor BrkB family protein [Paenibacillus rigui]|uniref:Ribonuclease n=1 Tax=Paenibacillus rigui TaxID=554312 RepID=A0A229UWF3_9BACL|nr:YihY/virulence factor BrkB family protein [Paenibacillus rigui]OXM87690.1 ribonuclease [Paenibacillus rigui]